MSKQISEEQEKALKAVLAQLDKQFGKGTVMRLGDQTTEHDIQAISTGSLGLDIALGIGGLPRGRIVEIYGPESSGKTTLTLHVIAEAQKAGGTAAFIDAEHALDPIYARKLGVNTDDLYITQPDTGEQALEIADALVRSGAFSVIVIDSVAALTPKAEIEGEMGDSHVGLQARLMSQALRKLTANIKRANTLVIFINQIRMKIGVMFGSPETTTGGNALKFYASVRLDIRRIGSVKEGDEVLGNQTRVKVVKNKVSPPFKQAEFDVLYGQGISRIGEIIDLGVAIDVIQKSGAWYSYGSDKIGQGKEKVRAYLTEKLELAAEIEVKIREHYIPPRTAMSSSDDARRAIEARCLAALGRREYSRAELAAKLGEFPAEDVAAVLETLAERGWQSDARFAESYLRGHRGYGRLKMRHELEARGIRGELLRETLDSADWFAAAREVYQKKYSAPATTPQERAKRQRFMAQRGFSYEEIQQAMTATQDEA